MVFHVKLVEMRISAECSLKRWQNLRGRHRWPPVCGWQGTKGTCKGWTTSHVLLSRKFDKLLKSFEEQVPPVARASQGRQHEPEPREARLLVHPCHAD